MKKKKKKRTRTRGRERKSRVNEDGEKKNILQSSRKDMKREGEGESL